jgi:hypothetical protein
LAAVSGVQDPFFSQRMPALFPDGHEERKGVVLRFCTLV